MKKSFPSNINGRIYYIDEDAFVLLDSYLTSLRTTFTGETGEEIVADIETRISELLDERAAGCEGQPIVTLADVNEIITIMGRPEELDDRNGEPVKECAGQRADGCGPTPPPYYCTQPVTVKKKLYRDPRNVVFGGVISGLACYLGWSVTAMRIAAVVLALCTYLGPCLLIYLIAWMVIPVADTPRKILEMQGEPVNVGSVGQQVLDNNLTTSSIFTSAGRLIGVIFLSFLGFIGVCVVLALAFALLVVWGVAIEFWDSSYFDMLHASDGITPVNLILLICAIAIPCIAILWGLCRMLFKVSAAPKWLMVSAFVVELLLIAGLIVCASHGAAHIGLKHVAGLLMTAPATMLSAPMA